MLQTFDDLAPEELHAEAWKVCEAKGWHFGLRSLKGGLQFWKMDLQGEPTFDALWEHARPRCEALVDTPLHVIQQYANGQTYGNDGSPHVDDVRTGCYTLLYYPMLEWKAEWAGETLFFNLKGEITFATLPTPNRALLFDSRIRHVGQAPNRSCTVLRVSVAYKLEAKFWQEWRSLGSSSHGPGPENVTT